MPEITLHASLESVHAAMAFVRGQLGERHADILTHVELAVEELLVNVAHYAYAGVESTGHADFGKLVLGCRWVNMDGDDQFCVWLKDWGHPFDPFREADTPDTSLSVEARNPGGLGLHLIKHVSSHYVYSGSDGSNTVELYFKARTA